MVSPTTIATRMGLRSGSMVEVSEAVTGDTTSSPLERKKYASPSWAMPSAMMASRMSSENTVSCA